MVMAMFSAFLTLLVGSLLMLATDFYRRYKMRRVLYIDLAGMFWTVKNIMAVTEVPEWDDIAGRKSS